MHMKVTGIICEYNPLHLGHEYQQKKARENGADCIICVMSGNFTQRGEPSILDKYSRARAAISCGADIVLELPFPFCSASAEQFALAGTYILDSVGADELCFGSERADKEQLISAAELISSEEFEKLYRENQQQDCGSASAFFRTYSILSGDKTPLGSNDLLGISYLRAIKALGSDMQASVIKRVGGGYSDMSTDCAYPGAMAIRSLISGSGVSEDDLSKLVPQCSLDAMIQACKKGTAPVSDKAMLPHILSFFRLHTPAQIRERAISELGGSGVLDEGDGLCERICACAQSSSSYDGFYSMLYNGRYTNSRVNRVILNCMLGVSDAVRSMLPEHTILLGADEVGCRYLSKIRHTSKIEIVTKPSDAPRTPLTRLSERSDSLYSLLMPQTGRGDMFVKSSPFVIK